MIKNYRVQFEVSPSFSINDNWLAFFYNNEFVSVANGFTYFETMALNQFGESIKILTFDSQLEETSYQVALVNPTDTDTPLYGPFSLVDITFNYNSSFFSNVSFTGISKGNYNYQINHTLTQLQLKSLYPLASQFRIGVYKLSDGSKTNFTSVSDVNTYQDMTILSSYTDDFSFVLVANFPNGTEVDCEVYPSTFNIADATTTTTTTTEEQTTTTTTTEEQTTTTTTTVSLPNYFESITQEVYISDKDSTVMNKFMVNIDLPAVESEVDGTIYDGYGGTFNPSYKFVKIFVTPNNLTSSDFESILNTLNDGWNTSIASSIRLDDGTVLVEFRAVDYFNEFSTYDAVLSVLEFEYVDGSYVFFKMISQDSTVYTIEDQVTTTTTTTEEQTTTTTTTEEQTTTTTTTEEQTTTTTTTVAPAITDYSLTFRKINYDGNSPKNAPLTISEFEGNFAYLSDYVNHLLGVIDGLNVTVTNLQSENQSLSNRVTNIENGGANN